MGWNMERELFGMKMAVSLKTKRVFKIRFILYVTTISFSVEKLVFATCENFANFAGLDLH